MYESFKFEFMIQQERFEKGMTRIDEHEMKQPHISLKRNGLKILLQGQKLYELTKRKGN